jgi:uncharacterized protein YgiM (DUF1202 family)
MRLLAFIVWLLLFGGLTICAGQDAYVVKRQAINIRARPSFKAAVIGQAMQGDTVVAITKDTISNWVTTLLPDSSRGYLYRKNLSRLPSPETKPLPQSSLFPALEKFNFSSLLSASLVFFLLLTGLVVLIMLLIHYLF